MKFAPLRQNLGLKMISLTAGQLANRSIGFLWIGYMSRHLGPSDFGLYNTVMSYVTLVIPASTLGLNFVAMRESSRNLKAIGPQFGTLLVFRVAAVTLLWSLLLIVLPRLGYPSFLIHIFWMAGLFLLVSSGTQVAESIYIARQSTHWLWMTQLISSVAWALMGTVVLRFGKGLNWVFATMVLNSALVYGLHAWVLRRRLGGFTFTFSRAVLNKGLREGSLMGGVQLLTTAGERTDRILLSMFCAPLVVGYYGLASMLVFTVIESLWHPLTTVLFPIMSQMKHDGQVSAPGFYRRTLVWTALLACPIVLLCYFLAHSVITTVWGVRYEPTVPLLRGLVLALPFIAWNRLLVNMLLTSDRENLYFPINCVTYALATVSNIILQPRWGAQAAVAIMVVSQVFQVGAYSRVLSTRLKHLWDFRRIFEVIALTLVLAFGVHCCPFRWTAVFVSLAIYVAIGYGRVLDDEDRRLIGRWTRLMIGQPAIAES